MQRHSPVCLAAAFAAALAAAPVQAEAFLRATPESPQQIALSFAPVAARTAPAVVNVFALKTSPQPSNHPFFEDPFFRRFFGDRGFGVPREKVQRSLGSGVIVDSSGLVVTNHHVIEGADQIRVVLTDKRELAAELVLRDPRSDLAVLRMVDPGKFPTVELGDSDALQVGDLVLAIGNPFGVGQTVTQGIVSALARSQVGVTDFQSFIQTDAAINPGNSGGALVDMAGKLVGINTAIFSRSGGSHGIGFAIPSNMVRVVVESARSGSSRVKRPWLGAQLQPVTLEIAEGLGLSRPVGALVADVPAGTPAAKGGLQRGDVIIAVDGQPVDDPAGLGFKLATRPVGGKAAFTVHRGNREQQLTIALEAPPESSGREQLVIKARSPFAGVTVAALDAALADEMRLPFNGQSVVVVKVERGSPAEHVGFQAGDLVLQVNGVNIGTPSDLDRVTKAGARLWRLVVQRDGQTVSMVFGG
ncbi:DegQ family serine endoprotease [Blastochloris viridis]|uniref:Putative periplasmic serine endoprotease DegP-like n=1 Tax=Blastochloris viridis TaxID=1079 RepID=A0A0H5BFH4_BLAVI|nr:DegQ family serine endoprotease [Blastochloris viridis]ALK09186.1 putative periplasmic serine endoprotease DegP-like precursor [Blastochloris viridis]BAS00948.1 serine protease precursor MucD/AlgY associated with sigma factor RpoE [Blastochloris viridis]CUU41849.1 putative periplasmic serine endoprotease DegP-like precursor [Blastochloris viridis]